MDMQRAPSCPQGPEPFRALSLGLSVAGQFQGGGRVKGPKTCPGVINPKQLTQKEFTKNKF